MATSCRLLLPGVISRSGNASFSHFSDIDFSEEKRLMHFSFSVLHNCAQKADGSVSYAIIFISFSQKISKSFYVCI